jgi:toxin-antitoxin system PIN domain toxin
VTVLLDANVLIALVVTDHVHHTAAETWLTSTNDSIATCPITQGSLVRLLIREGQSANTAHTVLTALSDNDRHEFWPDDITYRDVPLTGVIGHRQVTDAYLAQLARARSGRLATFDQGLAKLHSDITDLVPSSPQPRSR